MIPDFLTEVSTAQALAGAATVLSTGSIDLKVATRLNPSASCVCFNVNLSGVAGAAPTVRVQVVGADDAALTSNLVVLGEIAPIVVASQAAKNYPVMGLLTVKKRYVGLRYITTGADTAANVTAAAVAEPFEANYQG